MRSPLFLFILFFFFSTFPSLGQENDRPRRIHGRVIDGEGDPLPYVNVYLKPIGSNGTTTNEEGRFELEVDPPDADSVVFRYTGYKERSFPISTLGDTVRVTLRKREMVMGATTVIAGSDPGERIMDSVRAHRDDHLSSIGGYGASFYMKGKARLDSMAGGSPFSVRINGRSPDTASLLYLTESMSRFRFYPPDRIEEEMIASRVAGDPEGFSSNRARDLLKDPYRHRIELAGVSERGFVSPIGRSAPTYYEFERIGVYEKDGRSISKIKVIPKREHDPVFEGTVEVVEDRWRIRALDLRVSSAAPTEFVDSLRIKHEYLDWKGKEWLPLSLEETYWFSFIGIDATYRMVGRCKQHRSLKETPESASSERFRVDKEAREKDSSFWNEERPYVLEEEEKAHYSERDSLDSVRTSEPYLDSLDSANNRLDVNDVLWSGYGHRNSLDSTYWGINSLTSAVGFNTVEGWRFRIRPYFRESLAGGKERRYSLEGRYGLASETPFLKGTFTFDSDPIHSERWQLEGGETLQEVNATRPLAEWLNSIYSLTRQRNYLKLYRRRFLKAGYRREWVNGFYAAYTIEWAERSIPPNRSSQTWFPRSDGGYTPNRFHRALESPSRIFRNQLTWTLRPGQEFESYPNEKRVIATPYPEVYGRLEAALPLGDDHARFGRVEVGTGEYFELGLGGRMRVDLYGGDHFFQEGDFAVMDRKHFKGNRTLLMNSMGEGKNSDPWGSHRLRSFHTLPYYARFTRERYGAAHLHHRFQGAILNKLPLVRRLGWQMLTGGNALYTEDQGSYAEFYVGIENIFKFFRVDVALSAYPTLEEQPYWRIGVSESLF